MAVDPTIVVATIVTGGAIITSTIAAIAARRTQRKTEEVHYQVKNSHTTNLREDLDLLLHGQVLMHRELIDVAALVAGLDRRLNKLEGDRAQPQSGQHP